jgi:hypothetical protein
MTKPHNQGPGTGSPPANRHGNGNTEPDLLVTHPTRDAHLMGNDALIQQVRQIISETPETRPEKVAPLKEAVKQGAYEIDGRKLANVLITKLIIDL